MLIKRFKINNFRSLVNFELSNLGTTTILYGDNNAGKSNVLKALQLIFSIKAPNISGSGGNFYQGIIPKFDNDYYRNNPNNIINFYVEVELSVDEVELEPSIKKIISPSRQNVTFKISGQITPQVSATEVTGVFETTKIVINNTTAYTYENGKFSHFPKLQKKDSSNAGELASAFEKLINPLNDCVYMIERDRDMYISTLSVDPIMIISPSNFKNFLHSLYLSTREYQTFEFINKVFNAEPFSFGTISFSTENKILEIMIQNDNVRYPIKHLGSGVLQTLYIIASVIYCKKKIICIEEPEQNLSPERQTKTIGKLQSLIDMTDFRLDQLILSSHSPFLFDVKISNSIFLLNHNGQHTIIEAVKKPDSDTSSAEDKGKFKTHFTLYAPHFPGYEDWY